MQRSETQQAAFPGWKIVVSRHNFKRAKVISTPHCLLHTAERLH
jgi:hypothetical protein